MNLSLHNFLFNVFPYLCGGVFLMGSLARFDRAAIERMVPMKRAGTAAEVAALVAFLASDEAGYISGQVVSINGAMI